MSCHRKLYPDVFEPNILISLHEKKGTNLRMIDKNVYLLREIKAKKKYLHDYWYSLKYLVHALHTAYRLLYKVLGKYGNSSMCWRNKHHHLMKGPRTIAKNLAIFSDLVAFVDIQICLIGSII